MDALENLVRINKLNHQPANRIEFIGLVATATTKLKDVSLKGLSAESQFSLAYGAAHSLSLAALRWHGYRTDKRYLVFQCLPHTLGLSKSKWRVLDKCHHSRNLAEYEGQLEIDNLLLEELIAITHELLDLVNDLGVIKE